LLLTTAMCLVAELRRRRKRHSCWTTNWISRRNEHSISNNLVQEVQQEDEPEFRGMFRMNVESFQYLLRLVEPVIAKQDTRMRESVSARERLQIQRLR